MSSPQPGHSYPCEACDLEEGECECERIKCDCNDPECDNQYGLEGEVPNHVDNCSCNDCHRHYSKLN